MPITFFKSIKLFNTNAKAKKQTIAVIILSAAFDEVINSGKILNVRFFDFKVWDKSMIKREKITITYYPFSYHCQKKFYKIYISVV